MLFLEFRGVYLAKLSRISARHVSCSTMSRWLIYAPWSRSLLPREVTITWS